MIRAPIRISGGTLRNSSRGVVYESERGGQIVFAGARFVLGYAMPGTAYQMCGVIRISRRWLHKGFTVADFAHEYGHFLQQRNIGTPRYLLEAVRSGISLTFAPRRHYSRRFEQDATHRGMVYAQNHIRKPARV